MKPGLLIFTLLMPVAQAAAQSRPLQTEEAQTAAARTVTVEIGADAIRAEPNFQTGRPRDTWAGPVLRVVFSPADNVEIDTEWTARVGARSDPDFGTVSDFGDVALRAKVRIRDGENGGPTLAARFGVTLPQTSFGQGLGPNVLRMSGQVLFSDSFGATRLHLNAGLGIHDEVLRPHEQTDFLVYGAAVAQRLATRLEIVAELAGAAGQGRPGADSHHEARAGVRVGGERLRFDAAVRRGLGHADGTWGLTAGVRVRRVR